jgi:hypothetical protein
MDGQIEDGIVDANMVLPHLLLIQFLVNAKVGISVDGIVVQKEALTSIMEAMEMDSLVESVEMDGEIEDGTVDVNIMKPQQILVWCHLLSPQEFVKVGMLMDGIVELLEVLMLTLEIEEVNGLVFCVVKDGDLEVGTVDVNMVLHQLLMFLPLLLLLLGFVKVGMLMDGTVVILEVLMFTSATLEMK